jgi:hypothetical protein
MEATSEKEDSKRTFGINKLWKNFCHEQNKEVCPEIVSVCDFIRPQICPLF